MASGAIIGLNSAPLHVQPRDPVGQGVVGERPIEGLHGQDDGLPAGLERGSLAVPYAGGFSGGGCNVG